MVFITYRKDGWKNDDKTIFCSSGRMESAMKTFIVCLLSILLLFTAKGAAEQISRTKESIETQYHLEDVLSHIRYRSANEHLLYPDLETSYLFFDECSMIFNIELTRFDKQRDIPLYSIYLFWDTLITEQEKNWDLTFYFYTVTLYNESNNISPQTLMDVVNAYPYTQFMPYISHGSFSYSYMNGNILMVEYETSLSDHDALLYKVKKMGFVDREKTPSCFSRLLEIDCPH